MEHLLGEKSGLILPAQKIAPLTSCRPRYFQTDQERGSVLHATRAVARQSE